MVQRICCVFLVAHGVLWLIFLAIIVIIIQMVLYVGIFKLPRILLSLLVTAFINQYLLSAVQLQRASSI